ncbi:MAG: cytochrome c biogenesis protein CcsA [Bdellovibrionaceae bacterium]|nr:cytochrome c biogenesis protein CcsA [Pseudobdellovibrionaceae bacterium]
MFFLTLLVFPQQHSFAALADPLKTLHIQDGGRIKPFNTFATEALQLVYGRETFKGLPSDEEGKKNESRDAIDILLTWMLIPEHWNEAPIIQIRHNGLKEALGLDPEKTKKTHFSPAELMRNDRLALLIQELNNQREAQEKLDPYFQAVQTLESQISMFQAISTGVALKVLPPSEGSGIKKWFSLNELNGDSQKLFSEITQSFIKLVTMQISAPKPEEIKKVQQELKVAVEKFKEFARKQDPQAYGEEKLVELEVHLKDFHPFQKAWIAYLLATLFAVMAFVSNKSWAKNTAWVFMFLGLALHSYGMFLRVYIIGRPPVSNMYETVIWVPWGTVFFSMILTKLRKNYLLFICSGLVATLCLILSDLSPVVLDSSLQPLEPVLRDNFWLVVHVIIIVTSYAAFFLAFALGDILLIYFLRGEEKYKAVIKEGVHGIYRSIQIGIVLLALGIITGGIWADYSWGRFWGWDPKETWALIALLGYVAVLHGRLAGWVKDFGMTTAAVITFSLVIMAWYGVNFVLGAGLHTYGFGAGGVEYVSAFVAFHILYVVYVATVRKSRLSKKD